ncbi:hypothetical protein JX266_012464 [Neoarthrinium moseri]|nr:hypothetical protein JX266_012464 [Neoarthrinium moseri]
METDMEPEGHLNTEGIQGLFDDEAPWALNDISMNPFGLYQYGTAQMNNSSMAAFEQPQAGIGEYHYRETGGIASVPSSQCEVTVRSFSTLSTGLKFLHLQQGLTELIIKLNTTSWDVPVTLKIESQAETYNSLTGARDDNSGFNPLTSTFDLISKFDRLLQSIGNQSSPADLPEDTGNCALINAQIWLNSLACYKSVLSVYDCLVSYILDEASTNQTVENFILHTSPKLSIAGFEIHSPRNIFGQLFVRLLELRIEPIESALGIPDTMRISNGKIEENKTIDVGIFRGKDAKSLLNLLENSALEGLSSVTDLKELQPLRCKMKHLQFYEMN